MQNAIDGGQTPYTVVIEMVKEIVDCWQRRQRQEISRLINNLVGYMLDNFHGDEVSYEAVRVAFYEQRTGDAPARNTTVAFPVCVMRELCFAHKVNFRPDECSHWDRFVERYRETLAAV